MSRGGGNTDRIMEQENKEQDSNQEQGSDKKKKVCAVEVSDRTADTLCMPERAVCAADEPDVWNVCGESVKKEMTREERKKKKRRKRQYRALMAGEPVITAMNLVVRYRTMGTFSIRKQLLGRNKGKRAEMFEALHGISFEVYKGEILGIVGKNGSGKSTLLRAIGGIFSPDEGTVDLHGHQASLLAIGVGFQKDLTGRENIYLSSMLQGFTQAQVDEKVDEIIAFSELEKFIDKPVKTYSSGMHSKLAFSIAVNLDSDILLIDEVLSVGDAHFKKKSYAKMRSMIHDESRTVILVSHSLDALRQLCTRVLWINDGDLIKSGPPRKILKEYQKFMDNLGG